MKSRNEQKDAFHDVGVSFCEATLIVYSVATGIYLSFQLGAHLYISALLSMKLVN